MFGYSVRFLFIGLFFLINLFSSDVFAKEQAFGQPGNSFSWSTGEKDGMGTAYEAYDSDLLISDKSPTAPISRVWFTIAKGIVTEVYYPRIDAAQTRDTQFVITDGRSFFHEEQKDLIHEVKRLDGLTYLIINKDPQGRYEIQKTVFTDPNSDTLIQKVKIIRREHGLKFYVLHKPAAANTLFHDRAEAYPFIAGESHFPFGAWQGMHASIGFKKESVGYLGHSDGWTDLHQDKKMDFSYDWAPSGNVSYTAQLDIDDVPGSTEFSLYLFFGLNRESISKRYETISQLDSNKSLSLYQSQWQDYLQSLDRVPIKHSETRRRELYENSILVLKASEDKYQTGAVVASLSKPWGDDFQEEPHFGPWNAHGYHVVWPRDLYHIANGFLSVGDTDTAVAILRLFKKVQFQSGTWNFGSPRKQSKKGSFPQNFWTDGKTVWGGYQSDQTAHPIILAYQLDSLGVIDLKEFYPMVKSACEFLAKMGPWTQQERWEENHGISPNSAGAVISALAVGSQLAFKMDDNAGKKYLKLADQWATKPYDNIDTWTFTFDGQLNGNGANGKYYQRIDGGQSENGQIVWDAPWDPKNDQWLRIANLPAGKNYFQETQIVDVSFLELVRMGVRNATNWFVRESLPETDKYLRVETPKGPGFYRYRMDGYGENGKGRLWPFFTGERLHYELLYLNEKQDPNVPKKLDYLLRAFEGFATQAGLFPEQVWDVGPKSGQPTGAATPLTWAHAEYLQSIRSIHTNQVFEMLPFVYSRYGKNLE